MSGGTSRHNTIALNIAAICRNHVRGSQCRTYIADVKTQVEATNSFYYPDVMVACHPYNDKSVFIKCPVLIVEVLSRSTASIDRREKATAYRQIETLKEYLIVHQSRKQMELHRVNAQGNWDIFEFGPGAELILESIPVGPLHISIEAIYEDVDWRNNESGWLVREKVDQAGDENVEIESDW